MKNKDNKEVKENKETKETKKTKELLYTTEDIENELNRVKYKKKYNSVLRNTIYILVTVAAISVLLAVLIFPVLRIYGASMSPQLEDGEIVVCIKTSKIKQGDIVAFYYNNKILIKRVIAEPGEWFDIKEDGTVYINQEELKEDYLKEKALGDCNIELPYQIPDGRYFLMGDHRSVSIDSRHTSVGCISEDQIVGKLILKVWPFDKLEYFAK